MASKVRFIFQDVANLNVDTQEQQALVAEIEANQHQMKTVFDSIVSTVGTAKSQNANPSETLSTLQVSWSRMSIQTQAVSIRRHTIGRATSQLK